MGNAGPTHLETVSRGKIPELADPKELHPQPSRRQRGALLIELRVQKWWEVLVTLQFVPSGFVLRHPIYSRAAGSLPRIGSGGRNHTCLKRFMRPSSVHWSSFPQLELVESAGSARINLLARQVHSLSATTPKM